MKCGPYPQHNGEPLKASGQGVPWADLHFTETSLAAGQECNGVVCGTPGATMKVWSAAVGMLCGGEKDARDIDRRWHPGVSEGMLVREC